MLTSIKGKLAKLGLGMGDIVKMTVFMAARSAVQVAALLEIEVIAAKPH